MSELHVSVVAVSDLMSMDGSSGQPDEDLVQLIALLWIDPAMKLSMRLHDGGGGGRFPELVFHQDVLPHNATISIQVVSQGRRGGRSWLHGTAELPLAEVARMKAVRENPEHPDAVLLHLLTPTNHVRGTITLSISLTSGDGHRWGASSLMQLMPDQSAPVIGYPVAIIPHHEMQAQGQCWSSPGIRHVAVAGVGGAILGFVIWDILAIFFL